MTPPSLRRAARLVPIILCAGLAACSAAAAPSGSPGTSPAAASALPSASAAPTTVPPSASPSTAAVPAELISAVVALAAAEAHVDPATVIVVSAEPVTWKDGSLDCPRIGVMYTQGIEAGYKVVVSAAGRTLDYRWGRSGDPRLCLPPGASGE
jgi:hypothetical protein